MVAGATHEARRIKQQCKISAIGQFDNWNPSECAVDPANAAWWKREVAAFNAGTPPPIPKHIHQIWIGTREPPCVWLDSWRVDYMGGKHGKGWDYTLWDNDAAADFTDMVNRDLFDRERMWQCKADIMRLEILYKYGGVYADADLLWLGKPLDEVWEASKDTGFMIGYEPDTKDKPYSVLGNSIIMASKGHPLVRLLISYIAQIYDAKRPYNTVEWTTGPLACTKALVHTGMPFTVPDQELFYPMFHYVPNPDAIDFSSFPNSICFQFGYSCSGLAEWVKNNNRCRRALDCPYHSKKTDYPLGAIVPFPKHIGSHQSRSEGEIPRIIHQFQLSQSCLPTRWTSTWKKLAASKTGWVHKLWTYDALKKLGGFFCSHMYPEERRRMDKNTLMLLALEVLFKEGGYYVPLSTVYSPETGSRFEQGLPSNASEDLLRIGPIIAGLKGSLGSLSAIKKYYDSGRIELPCLATGHSLSSVRDQGYGDDVVVYTRFADGSRFLGASEIYFSNQSDHDRGSLGAAEAAVAFAYDCQAPIIPIDRGSLAGLRDGLAKGRSLFITDAQMALYPCILDAVPGLIYKANNQYQNNWSYILLGVEWSTGYDEETVFQCNGPFRIDGMTYMGVVVNDGKHRGLPESFSCSNDVVECVLGKFKDDVVLCGAVRFANNEKVSAIYRAMPVVQSVFQEICNHNIPSWDRDETEIQDNLLKGRRNGQVAFEISVDSERRTMYRAFNDDGAVNCEIKVLQGPSGRHVVDYARVFYDHTIIFEGSQIPV